MQDDVEPIAPSQAVLLKLIDADLARSDSTLVLLEASPKSLLFLVNAFEYLAMCALRSLESGRDDARLPKVIEALTLLFESMSSIGLKLRSARDQRRESSPVVAACVSEIKSEDREIVRHLIGTPPQSEC